MLICLLFQFYKVRLEPDSTLMRLFGGALFQFYKVRLEHLSYADLTRYFDYFNSIK